MADCEITIIDPNRSTAPQGNLHETLSEARDGSDPLSNRVRNQTGIQPHGRIQDQDSPDLHRR